MKTTTREQWLGEASHMIFDELIAPNTPIEKPPFRVSVGWPHANKGKHRTILGQCFPRSMSADNTSEIFITPTTGANDSQIVMATLLHELIHAVDDCQNGHKKPFADLAKACGLTGKMTATTAGDELQSVFDEYEQLLGPIPHAALDTSSRKKEKSRQLKLLCQGCGAIFRASKTVIEATTGPCPCCGSDEFGPAE